MKNHLQMPEKKNPSCYFYKKEPTKVVVDLYLRAPLTDFLYKVSKRLCLQNSEQQDFTVKWILKYIQYFCGRISNATDPYGRSLRAHLCNILILSYILVHRYYPNFSLTGTIIYLYSHLKAILGSFEFGNEAMIWKECPVALFIFIIWFFYKFNQIVPKPYIWM